MEKLRFQELAIDKDQLIDDLAEDVVLRDFFIDHDVDTDFIERHLGTFLNFKIEKDKCQDCEGIHTCKQDTLGLEPVLRMEEGQVKSYYQECPFNQNRQQLLNQKANIDALYMPKMIYEASMDDYDFTRGENRTKIYNRLTNFVHKYMQGEHPKGLYLYGAYQQGKTYSLGALANELSKRGVQVIIAYYPDLVREFKSRINDNTVETMIGKLKQIDVLMLDDIGGESQSAWIRDEILGPILQHRLLDEKPTFFTSNVSQKDLTYLLVLNNQMAEKMKAARIEARIKSLSEEFKM
ncbi:primosomal protein DnaI [Candidatus Xianfuyuplasma coldseepsis]|uniref:Primosomal protein DnaI n=1 Tax=Candidatus Xianfuyuplasma coldseepsis TaxID=2782163 RepID=A0A7L7KRV5_9MOLU|nr:primosomal protein DnaI [Xianfuyuplasma coldseepsis]QMS85551.1 primosomal protein DnaI [Xianfuyuplasma coldseepsis]